jgi:glycerol-1-phosphate dehydrogenase [NAD(P)+]
MKHIQLPRDIIVGKEVLDKAVDIARGFENPLVVTGPVTDKVAGSKVQELLGAGEVKVKKATAEEVKMTEAEITKAKAKLAVAVGGGTVIDVTKLAAKNTGIHYISVPTTCSHDGIASSIASLRGQNGSTSVIANAPLAIIADISIIANSPYKFIAAGVGDTIAKYSSVRDWKLAHIIKGEYYGDYASSLSLMVAEVVQNDVKEIRAVTEAGLGTLVEALISSGVAISIAGSSRPASGAEHKFSHGLDIVADHPALHGEQCGVGTIIMSYLHGENWKAIKDALETAGCPTTAKDLGVDNDVMLKAMMKAKEIRPERYTIIEHIKLNREIAENALYATGVIE